jgi:hypothetical protein
LRLLGCIEHTEDPEVGAALERLRSGLHEQMGRATLAGPGSEADRIGAELVGLANATAGRLLAQELSRDLRDALARLDADAEVAFSPAERTSVRRRRSPVPLEREVRAKPAADDRL